MMKRLIIHLCCLCLFALAACNNVPKEATPIMLRTDTGFLTYTGSFSNEQVAINSVSYANQQSGEVLLEFNLLNKSSEPLIVKYLLTELATTEGLRSGPEFAEHPDEIAAGKEVLYSLKYAPTNSRKLMADIGYQGDLEKTYELDLEFIGFAGEKLILTATEEDYANYLANYGMESSLKIFQITNKKEWLAQQKKCTAKPTDHSKVSSINLHDQELLVQGVVCKVSMYSTKDALRVSLRLANQSEQLINAIPEKLALFSGNKQLTVSEVDVLTSNRKNPKGAGVVLRKSERYQVDYIFENTTYPLIDLKALGVFLEENEQGALLCAPLVFEVAKPL
ncbi:MAG: hypothetical protein ACPGJS_12525 [Flammeovirgaceae bacterium]